MEEEELRDDNLTLFMTSNGQWTYNSEKRKRGRMKGRKGRFQTAFCCFCLKFLQR
jgi:hypothetical protein